MRVEINIPTEDKKFSAKIDALAKSEKRKRKNWIENLVITTVNNATVKPKQLGSNNA